VGQATKEVETRMTLRIEPTVARLLDRYVEEQNRSLAPAKLVKNDLINEAIVAYISARDGREERAS
jgi:hypothetical protein